MSDSLYFNRRVMSLLGLGFASGLPLALTGGTLQAWATVENVGLEEIGLLTLVGSAYTFKFLWAPLVDRFTLPFLGRRRGWVLLSQLLLMASLFAMSVLSPSQSIVTLAFFAVVVAFFSATQDIAFDAYRTDVLPEKERGAGAAVSVFGYRLAMLVSGGLALVIADRWLGWQAMYALMASLMGLSMLFTLFAPEPIDQAMAPKTLRDALVNPLVDFFKRDYAVWFIVLIIFYKLGDAFAGSLSTTFLIRGVGFDAAEVGSVNKIMGLIATIIGAILGGGLIARLGLFKSLVWFGILQAVSNLMFWVLAISAKNMLLMALAVGIENLCGGMGTSAFVALLMALCNKEFSATQFALLSAASALGRTYLAGPITPYLVNAYGWPVFFALTVAIALPGLLLLLFLRKALNERLNGAGTI